MLNAAIEYSSINQVKKNHIMPLDGLPGTLHKTFHYVCLVHGPHHFIIFEAGFTPVMWSDFSIGDVWTVLTSTAYILMVQDKKYST